MHLFTSILAVLALGGTALAQDGATAFVYNGPLNSCAGDPSQIEGGLVCNNCYSFGAGSANAVSLSNFNPNWLWYAFGNSNCNPNVQNYGAVQGNACFRQALGPIGSIFLKCNGNPGF
ncbi:hypothetical protein B0H13DRAFT_1903062 [Mycena leptocephala]|nr:hypothetical protein B0H13DRAFT_1903583 [Mycena leptocephala]KAJ7855540.1 hypothetical protein B0H13DRAFT_1903062 [Mycena leptocephala]